MNLGIVGDDISLIGGNSTSKWTSHNDWVLEVLTDIYNRSKAEVLVTYDNLGISLTARQLFKDAKKIVLTDIYYNFYFPLFANLVILDDDILAWADYMVIIGNGQRHPLFEKCRSGKVYEVNYLDRSQRWVTYAD